MSTVLLKKSDLACRVTVPLNGGLNGRRSTSVSEEFFVYARGGNRARFDKVDFVIVPKWGQENGAHELV